MDSINDFTSSNILSKEDINLLLADRSARAQLTVIGKLTEHYIARDSGGLNDEQTHIAHDIFRILMERGDVIVRAMLSLHLSQSEKLPVELALRFAEDSNSDVANPMLQYSDVLRDEDLSKIISSMVETAKLVSIARRHTVSEPISELLVSTCLEQVACALVENEGSKIPVSSFQDLVRMHKTDVEIMSLLLQRNAVPVPIIEMAVDSLPKRVRAELTHAFGDLESFKKSRRALSHEHEEGTLKMMRFKSPDTALMSLIKQLSRDKRLSPFSALGMCNFGMFENSLSRLLQIPVRNVRLLLSDAQGFTVAYNRAALPDSLHDATHLAVRALMQLEDERRTSETQNAVDVAQVMARMRALSHNKSVSGLEQLFAIMQYYNH